VASIWPRHKSSETGRRVWAFSFSRRNGTLSDQPLISPLTGKSVLVTGGTGTFGNAFVRRALADGARRVVVFSRGESKQAEMKAALRDDRVRYFIGDVRDLRRITEACRGVEIVAHAAALKRIEVCESDPLEANETNIRGTENVARACIAAGVEKAVLLSTDKAASPATHYGVTKLCAEKTWVQFNNYSAGTKTRFSASRYGNVLGSTGSVLQIWAKQGQEITLTDPDMSRFWMRIEDAVDLVVLALVKMVGGEVFIPRLGASTIGSLATAAFPDAKWNVTGPRPGEKKHELLICPDEAHRTYDAGSYYLIWPELREWDSRPVPVFPKVPFGFEYGSANAPTLGIESLRRMIA
jgi:UDP-N-acetylglucosamine 4,6-dehydratase